MIVRRIAEVSTADEVIGNPQEIQQYMMKGKREVPRPETDYPFRNWQDHTIKKGQQEPTNRKTNSGCIKIENQEG